MRSGFGPAHLQIPGAEIIPFLAASFVKFLFAQTANSLSLRLRAAAGHQTERVALSQGEAHLEQRLIAGP